jgi:hypothetical protein
MWKLAMVAVGIYMFFLLECVMKMYLHLKTLNVSVRCVEYCFGEYSSLNKICPFASLHILFIFLI